MIIPRTRDLQFRNHLLNLCIFLFIFRTISPYFKWGFIIILPLTIFSNFKLDKVLKFKIKEYARFFILPIVIICFIIYAFLISEGSHSSIVMDLINTILAFLLLTVIILANHNISIFKQYVSTFISFVILFSVLQSLYEIISFYLSLLPPEFSPEYISARNKRDYNFGLIPIFLGIVAIIYHKEKYSNPAFILITTALFVLTIFISCSRRGSILLLIMLVSAIIRIAILLNNRTKPEASLVKKNILFVISAVFTILSIILFYSYTSVNFKVNLLNSLNIEVNYNQRFLITRPFYRMTSIFNKDITMNKLYKNIWSTSSHEPSDPDSGWGTRIHNTAFPLEGKNVKIVPTGVKGYQMDKNSNASTWNNNAYSFTLVNSSNLAPGDSLIFSAYCFVSEEFNGDFAKLKLEGIITNNQLYDLDNIGKWQQLKISAAITDSGEVRSFLYWGKLNATNFLSLTGYVIFAYPEVKIIKNKRSSKQVENIKTISNFSSRWKNFGPKTKFASALQLIDVSKLAKLAILPDTSIHKPISNTGLIYDTQNYLNNRTSRWKFAFKIFYNEYSWKKKVFGGGFDYLNLFGYYFYNDKTREDWPHNPFLSVLLYSGILGLGLYLFFMYKVFYYYIKYRKEYGIFFIFFLITFFFSFFSSNGPFDPPVWGFFVLLPFFIHFIHEKEKKNKEELMDINLK